MTLSVSSDGEKTLRGDTVRRRSIETGGGIVILEREVDEGCGDSVIGGGTTLRGDMIRRSIELDEVG